MLLRLCLSRRLSLLRNGAITRSKYNSSLSEAKSPENIPPLSFPWFKEKLTNIQLLYDDITGLKEVHEAQNRVIDAENNFVVAQDKRRKFQEELRALQRKLKDIYNELDKTPRGEDRYVQLVTMEHSLIKEEKRILEVFQEKERDERDSFNALSSAVKMGHEKERAQAERTKYWSIIGSVFGTLLGMLASSIINDRRMKELRSLVTVAVSKSNENSKDCSNVLIENEIQLKTIASSIRQLNEILAESVNSAKQLEDKPIEENNEMLTTGLIASFIVSAGLILIFRF